MPQSSLPLLHAQAEGRCGTTVRRILRVAFRSPLSLSHPPVPSSSASLPRSIASLAYRTHLPQCVAAYMPLNSRTSRLAYRLFPLMMVRSEWQGAARVHSSFRPVIQRSNLTSPAIRMTVVIPLPPSVYDMTSAFQPAPHFEPCPMDIVEPCPQQLVQVSGIGTPVRAAPL